MAELSDNDVRLTNFTSPRILQEMALMPPPPALNEHDVTNTSVISLKQYEEQLKTLKKENFNLRVRVYLLEEKLGSGADSSSRGLLEHNVRLQVEVMELKRQLSDKQELLLAAAEALDLMEQKGSISSDSIEAPSTPAPISKTKKILDLVLTGNETCPETESAGEPLPSCTEDEMNEVNRLRRDKRRALQMLKECIKKIQTQDKKLKKLETNKDTVSQASDTCVETYEETLKCKDEYIKDLENKVMELQKNVNDNKEDNSGNLQELLTRRLQGLVYFLDKLLAHKCVLGEDKKKIAERLLELSVALPVDLQLDESMKPEDFTMDKSSLDMTQSWNIEDLTLMFGHHASELCGPRRAERRDVMSESECWSEPDRNVSLARMGLAEPPVGAVGSVALAAAAAGDRPRGRRARPSHSHSHEERAPDPALLAQIESLKQQIERAQLEKEDLEAKLENARMQIDTLLAERNFLNETIATERTNVIEANKLTAKSEQALLIAENKIKELETASLRWTETVERLRTEKQELELSFSEREAVLRRAADEAALQASQAALERARQQRERLRVETELDELRAALAAAPPPAAAPPARAPAPPARAPALSEDERPTSPDQGIDSDRLSSLEQIGVNMSPRSLYEENLSLKQKLARSKATLADTLAQLNEANMRKRSVQRAICREIHKTHSVLRQARDQLENQNSE